MNLIIKFLLGFRRTQAVQKAFLGTKKEKKTPSGVF